jgi:hypothetical protein
MDSSFFLILAFVSAKNFFLTDGFFSVVTTTTGSDEEDRDDDGRSESRESRIDYGTEMDSGHSYAAENKSASPRSVYSSRSRCAGAVF